MSSGVPSPLLRAYVRGMVLEAHRADDGSTHFITRRDQQHKGVLGRLRQHVAHALFRAGELCHPRHYHRGVRVVELYVSPAPVDDQAAYIAEHYVLQGLPANAPNGDTHHQALLLNECVEGHDDGRPPGKPLVRFREWQESADDAHVWPWELRRILAPGSEVRA